MKYICPSCGVRLNKDYKFCPNCGYNLAAEDGVNLSPKSKEPGKSKTPQVNQGPKTLSSKAVAAVVVAVLGVILIILAASGVFDSVPETNNMAVNQPAQQPPAQSQGVDLSMVNEINQLEEKVKANPDDLESLLHLAHIKNDARMYPQAIETYKIYLEKNPKNADARVDMGVCYFNLQNFESAIDAMQTALTYEPKHQIAHLNLGIVNLTAGNAEKAKEWFRKAVEINPNNEVGQRAQELLTSH